jgi:hypothetical protein
MQQPPNPYPQYPQQQWQQPPIPPQQYQQPPQYQPPMQPPKKKSRKRLWLILAAVVLVLAVSSVVASQGQSQQPAPTTQATQQPTNAPTKQAPTPTAIPVLHAVLGGTEASFNARFGADTNTAGRARRYTFSVDGQKGTALVMLDDNDPNVRFITVKPVNAGTVWNATIGQDAVRLFMPSDARHIKDIQDPTIGTEHVYTSATLAKTFPASSFTDVNSGNQVAAGTFYFNCDNGQNQDNATHVGACTIGLGQ